MQNFPPGEWPIQTYRWEGAFIRLQVLVGINGYFTNGMCLLYDVDGEGNMHKSRTEIEAMHFSREAKVRVLAYGAFKWIIDLEPDVIKLHWKLRLFEKTLFCWKDPYECSVKRLVFF